MALRRLVSASTCLILFSISALTPAVAVTPLRIISRSSSGRLANQGAGTPTVSATGRFVAFASISDNLVPRDRNEKEDIFWRDRRTRMTKIVSVNSTERRSNGNSGTPSISANGQKIIFTSDATNLVAHDENGREDVFTRNLGTGKTRLVSLRPNGIQFNMGAPLHETAISANGRYAAFTASDTREPGRGGIYVRDLREGRTTRIGIGRRPVLDADGSKLVYLALWDDPKPDGAVTQVIVESLRSGRRRVASRSSSGSLGNSHSFDADISAGGRFVAFSSLADNLVPTRASDHIDVFWRDMRTRRTRLVSVGNSGPQRWGQSDGPSISGDGWSVAFWSSRNLHMGEDGPGTFVRLVGARRTLRLDHGLGSGDVDISGDGLFFAFAVRHVYGARLGSR